ncbi:unnamed protein product, partial [Mesorhabditis spiculigera]
MVSNLLLTRLFMAFFQVQKGIARSPVKNEAGEALVKFLAPNPSQRTIPGLSEAKAPTYTRMGVYRKKSEASPPKTVSSERVMKATWEDMEQFRLKPGQRDYCAHHLIDLMKCQTKNAPFAGHACDDQRGAWDKCEYEDHLMRIKEYERERRLLHRKQRKEHA